MDFRFIVLSAFAILLSGCLTTNQSTPPVNSTNMCSPGDYSNESSCTSNCSTPCEKYTNQTECTYHCPNKALLQKCPAGSYEDAASCQANCASPCQSFQIPGKICYSCPPPPPKLCGNGFLDPNEDCDPPGAQCNTNGNPGNCDATCHCKPIDCKNLGMTATAPDLDAISAKLKADFLGTNLCGVEQYQIGKLTQGKLVCYDIDIKLIGPMPGPCPTNMVSRDVHSTVTPFTGATPQDNAYITLGTDIVTR